MSRSTNLVWLAATAIGAACLLPATAADPPPPPGATGVPGPARAAGEAVGKEASVRLTPDEQRGRRIYLRGSSASGGEITVLLGEEDPIEAPASSLPCGGCHGHDGRGRPEGGVSPSDITPEALTKPYEAVGPGARKHPPYDDRSLLTALVQGRDPAGNKLSGNMPRYLLGREDARDLLAYMKRLGTCVDPGISKDRIRIGTLLPAQGSPEGLAAAVEGVIRGYCSDLDEAGGIYGRKIEVKLAAAGRTPGETAMSAKRLLVEEEVFALVGAIVEGAEKEVGDVLSEHEAPLVGAITSSPEGGFPPNRHVFYLLSGIREQGRAMVDFAGEKLGADRPRAAMIVPETEKSRGAARSIEEQCKRSGWTPPSMAVYPPGSLPAEKLVEELQAARANVLFFLGPEGDQPVLLREADRAGWRPLVFIPGVLTGREITEAPAGFQGRVFLSFPRGPSDASEAGFTEYRAFAEKHRLPSEHLSTQVAVYCAMKVFGEALKRAGRDLSREQLVTTLEGLYEFQTGLSPPITFGPNRRIGALGACMAVVDTEKKMLVPASGWLKVR